MNYAPERRPTLPAMPATASEPRMPGATFDASYPSYPMPSDLSRNLPSSMQDEGLQHTTSMGLDSLSLGAGGRNYAIPGMGPDTLGGAMGSRAFGMPGLGPDGLGSFGSTYGEVPVPGIGSMKAFEVDSGGATGSRAFATPGVALDAPGASRYGMSGMALEGPGVAGSRAFSTPIGFLDTPGAARNSRAFGVPGSIPGILPDPGVAGSHLSGPSPGPFDAPGVIGSRTFPMPGMAPDRPDPGSGFAIPKIDFDPGQRWSLPMTNMASQGPTGFDLGLDRANIQKEANFSFPTAGSFVAEAYQEGVPSYASESRTTPCELPLGQNAARFSARAPSVPGESHVPNGGAVEGCGNKPIAADTGYAATNGFGSSYPPPGRGDTYSGGTMSYGPPPERPGGGLPSACLPAFLHLPSHSMSAPYGALPPDSLGVPRMPPPLPCYAGPGFEPEGTAFDRVNQGYGKALGSFSLPGAHLQPLLGGPCPASLFAIPPTGSFIADASILGSPNPSLLTGFASGFEQKGEPRSVSKSVQVSPDSPMARGNASPPAKAAPRPVTKQSKKKTNRTCC